MEQFDPIICRCEEVLRSEIIEAIARGAVDWRGLKRRTRAGLGACQGQVCSSLVRGILAEYSCSCGKSDAGALRPPARPIRLGTLGEEE